MGIFINQRTVLLQVPDKIPFGISISFIFTFFLISKIILCELVDFVSDVLNVDIEHVECR